jgi:two-component system sensor histidine kinase ResE
MAGSFNVMASQVAATRQAQRDFVANVSHDLKTPLTSIAGWSQALLDGTAGKAEQQQQAARIIYDEAGRMGRLVNQLLDLARIESGELQMSFEPVDLQQLLGDIQRNSSLRAEEKGIQLTVVPEHPNQGLNELGGVERAVVAGDRDRLIQIITNLVDNALDHTPAGGRVHLELKSYGDKAVELVVQDNGPGIPADELGRIFERFYQVDKSRSRTERERGAGLGLAIVKELVEAHQGRIFVQSQVGQGSDFVVRLPLVLSEGTAVTRPRLPAVTVRETR